jgi:hypothetical protein
MRRRSAQVGDVPRCRYISGIEHRVPARVAAAASASSRTASAMRCSGSRAKPSTSAGGPPPPRRHHPRAEAPIGPRRGTRWMGRAWVADDGRMGRFADMLVDQRQATGATPTRRREPSSQLTVPCSLPTSWTTRQNIETTTTKTSSPMRHQAHQTVVSCDTAATNTHDDPWCGRHTRPPDAGSAPRRGSRSAGSEGRVCQVPRFALPGDSAEAVSPTSCRAPSVPVTGTGEPL